PTDPPGFEFEALDTAAGGLYLGSYAGAVYQYDAAAGTWFLFSDGLPARPLTWPRINSIGRCGDNLMAAEDQAIWSRPLSQTVGTLPSGPLSSGALTLSESPSGSIAHFRLSESGSVDFRIWDASGRLSAVLLNARMMAGAHDVLLPKASQAGIRFLTLRAGGRVSTLRFV